MAEQLSARQFVLNSDQCPVCGAQDVEWGEIRVEGTSTYQEGSCDCGARFYTVSRLVGYGLYQEGGPDVRTIEEDFGEITEAPAGTAAIRIDYSLLDRQIKRLGKFILPPAERTTAAQIQINQDLEGLFELLCQIQEQRPFPEGKE